MSGSTMQKARQFIYGLPKEDIPEDLKLEEKHNPMHLIFRTHHT